MKRLIYIVALFCCGFSSVKAQVVLEALDAPDAEFIVPDGWDVNVQPVRYLASVYDDNYYPFNSLDLSSQPATAQLGKKDANGKKDPLLNYQGKIGDFRGGSGITMFTPNEALQKHVYAVNVTFTASSSNAKELEIPSTIATARIPAKYIKNSDTDVEVYLKSYFSTEPTSQNSLRASGDISMLLYISAEKPIDLVQLDMNNGIGKDGKGILLTTFEIPRLNETTTTLEDVLFNRKLEVRLLPGIPDRYANQKTRDYAGNRAENAYEHDMFYMPILGTDGKIWLNNNLGANYSKLEEPVFYPFQRAKNIRDKDAFGSHFEWGRMPDGHELLSGLTDENEIEAKLKKIGWIKKEDLKEFHNPCPTGYHAPSIKEYKTYVYRGKIKTVWDWHEDVFKGSGNGRFEGPFFNRYFPYVRDLVGELYLWTSSNDYEDSYDNNTGTKDGRHAVVVAYWNLGGVVRHIVKHGWQPKDAGYGIRCIKD
ncbi:hypothetical protein [Riemerella columbina]|uniref:hypothetical protein n=1 Tax=Riemerella columbina TaxID=103810 RepID=UPI00035CCA6F|nr:hypothetical protein [Riemerella columbina]